ncbi:kinase-associated lipoprotein B [Robertmurraya andreesenii]|uniref:Kinase-associated protein B n=1 Tax=Anoxybacillus andreesenii TaxID=1325932 RepID=A0ABT9V326_9BACL|nr:kinase-associated lipoprotein B [Robertmurraya andreesenii]MDQ0155339.1 kinase-associated protein B [Robertmurraya andreesenii]
MSELKIGDYVTAFYKTGKYIGEITDIRGENYLVRVLAVAKHPMQGDIHTGKDADVPFFHERRALAYREQANMPRKMVKPFEGEVPDYKASLREAVDKLKSELTADPSLWAEKSLRNIEILEQDYFK